MEVYFSAQIEIKDQEEYSKYLAEADEIFSRFGGRYLSVDNSPSLLEGDWNYTRSVLIRFESREDFEAWYYSDEYQRILKFRLKAAKCDSILLKGIDPR